jgi:signal transduction histidine kinase
MVAFHSIRLKTIWWPVPFALFFWCGFLVAFFICSVVIRVRVLVDSSEMARLKAEKAERETVIAYDQQVQLNELKDQFLLNVSHELRTPLTVLGGSLELLFEHYEKLDPMKRADLLNLAIENHEELVSLVNRMLDAITIARELPPVQYKVVPVRQFMQELLTRLAPENTRAYTFRLEIPEQITVWADPQYLCQVLRNLLDNVFKYVPKQTEVRITTAYPAPSSLVCLSVQDAGPGIPPEEHPFLFEKFVRLKRDLAMATRGAGLGLYICKQLMEAMGGQIWVESSGRMGEGSRFCLTLPPSAPPSLL